MSSTPVDERTIDSTSTGDDELGFLFLEDCDVAIVSGKLKETNSAGSASLDLYGKWLPVCNLDKSENDSQDACPHCRLNLQTAGDNSHSVLAVGPTPRFDGTTSDLKPDERLCTCNEKLKQRSDGALLLGLALTCHDMENIVIRSVQVLLRNVKGTPRGSLVITLSIPEVTCLPKQNYSPNKKASQKLSNAGLQKRRFISKSAKPLPPATQLLLSVLQSDWDFLDHVLEHPEILTKKRTERLHSSQLLSFFPSKLSLDAVYQRVGGASASFLDKEEALRPTAHFESNLAASLDLPKEIWQYHIGSFLRAKSLDALRCTSKYFHRILQEVVPGLRLRLYSHQVKSLSWMRMRETKPIVENHLALDKNDDKTAWEDIHNAASGGATVLLRRRRRNTRRGSGVCRISQYNAEEVLLPSNDPLSRSIARGGLLCDDPGLGKTITVLSLVLQTMGLSTDKENRDAERSVNGKEQDEEPSYEERIFSEYWREQSIPQFRAQALNKLLSRFIRENSDTNFFVFPVDPERDEAPGYFKVISSPICFQDIRQAMNNYAYDESFAAFEADVVRCFR